MLFFTKKNKTVHDLVAIEDLDETVENTPVVRYVDDLLVEMVENGEWSKVLSPNNIPVNKKYETVDYNHVVNRLKVMTGLNPYPYKEAVKGEIPLRVAASSYTMHIVVAPNDESLEVNIEPD